MTRPPSVEKRFRPAPESRAKREAGMPRIRLPGFGIIPHSRRASHFLPESVSHIEHLSGNANVEKHFHVTCNLDTASCALTLRYPVHAALPPTTITLMFPLSPRLPPLPSGGRAGVRGQPRLIPHFHSHTLHPISSSPIRKSGKIMNICFLHSAPIQSRARSAW
jgi:hypothetical protein